MNFNHISLASFNGFNISFAYFALIREMYGCPEMKVFSRTLKRCQQFELRINKNGNIRSLQSTRAYFWLEHKKVSFTLMNVILWFQHLLYWGVEMHVLSRSNACVCELIGTGANQGKSLICLTSRRATLVEMSFLRALSFVFVAVRNMRVCFENVANKSSNF